MVKQVLVIALATGAVLVGLALAPLASAEDVGINLNLDEINGSGITGSAQLGSTTEDLSTTEVMVDVGGLEPDGTHINHIHDGTGCAQGEYAGVVVTLNDLMADGTGSAQQTTTVTQNDNGDPFGFMDIADGNHVLIVHDAAGAPASCAAIPAAQLPATPTATQEAATATVPAPTATVSAVPATGIDGSGDSGVSGTLIALVAGGLAAFGFATFGLGYAARRLRG